MSEKMPERFFVDYNEDCECWCVYDHQNDNYRHLCDSLDESEDFAAELNTTPQHVYN